MTIRMMKTIGNILWVVFGGFAIALDYLLSSIVLMLTIVGIPFGLQTLKLGMLALWPFGSKVVKSPASGCLNTFMTIIWLVLGGIRICLYHFFLGVIFYITIIGIPFGKQHFKLAGIALTPFGREIIPS